MRENVIGVLVNQEIRFESAQFVIDRSTGALGVIVGPDKGCRATG